MHVYNAVVAFEDIQHLLHYATWKLLVRAGPPPGDEGKRSVLEAASGDKQPQQESHKPAVGKAAKQDLTAKAEAPSSVPSEKDAAEKDATGKS